MRRPQGKKPRIRQDKNLLLCKELSDIVEKADSSQSGQNVTNLERPTQGSSGENEPAPESEK
jgi:hypothetical protein